MTTKMLQDAQFKATQTSTKTRTLDFYAAAFSTTPDKNGDTIDPHAFDLWLATFYAIGKPLPISFAHGAVLDSTDPFAIIGSAPADPDHVWTDDYGLRVKAIIDVGANDTARQVASLIDQGIVTGASIAFVVPPGGDKKQDDGSFRIMQAMVKEAGPCLSPAEEKAVVLALKAVRDELAGDHDPEPDPEPEDAFVLKHAASPTYIQNAHDALVRAGAKCAANEAVVEKREDVESRLRNLRLIEASIT